MWEVDINNIAGIRSGSTSITPGLNIVQASNFQGKSSFIAALQTVMGATGHYGDHPLTEGADTGSVTLRTDTDTYEVSISRERGANSLSGTPYLTDENDQLCARLFAFLGEDNPIRTAVRNGDDITEFLQEPLNIEEIDRQISDLKDERRDVEKALTQAERAAENLPSAQESVTQVKNELEELRAKKAELEDAAQETDEVDDLSDELSERRSTLQTHTEAIQSKENRLEDLESRLEAAQTKLEDLDEPQEVETLAELDEKQERIDALSAKIDLFERLHRANKAILDDGDIDALTDVERTISGDEIECWVCGSTTPREEMEARIDRIDERVSDLQEQQQQLITEVEEHQQRKREAEEQQRKYEDTKETIGTLKEKIRNVQSELDNHRRKKEFVQAEVDELEMKIAEAQHEYNEQLADVKTKIRTAERKLEAKQEQLDEFEAKKASLEGLRESKAELTDEIKALREEKTETQRAIADEFDAAISDIIDRYAPGFESARFDVKTNKNGDVEKFDLIIARDGRETTVDALSEGEVELIGVAVALAGYRVYDVGDRVPLILIDGISQLASEHLQQLTDYLEDAADVLVTTAYPEASGFDGEMISPEEWEIVSHESASA
ncbi:chromosome segregation protein SMC [Haloplanus salinarum]|uniref:archaea-specific SMC-related protein n=1 Tax=Haloplanus salinarum TaxID=1912324 RepID=UPI003B4314D0